MTEEQECKINTHSWIEEDELCFCSEDHTIAHKTRICIECRFTECEIEKRQELRRQGISIGLEKAIELVNDLYAQLPSNKVWGLGADEVCDNCEELIKNKLKSALSESEKK